MSKDEKADPPEETEEEAGEDSDEGDSDETEGSDGDQGEVEEQAKPAAPKAAPPKAALREGSDASGESASVPVVVTRPRPILEAPPPPPPPLAMGKRFVVFGIMLVALTAGLYILPANDVISAGPSKWKPGGVFDVTITLVKDDAVNLACGASGDVGGRKCEYQNKTDKSDGIDDAHLLKPYTTTDQVQFLAAGLWSQPALDKAKLPGDRFSVQCKYHVEGTFKSPLIRWNPTSPWGEKNPDWNTGYVSDCKLNAP